MENEIWKDIQGYEGLYQISNMGRVKSLERMSESMNRIIHEKTMNGVMRNNGYMVVKLFDRNGKRKQMSVHRLVALHFIPIIKGKDFVNHINCIRHDNRAINLEWVTLIENQQHALKSGSFHTHKIKCLQSGVVYDGIRVASRVLNIDSGSIVKVLNGKSKSVCGLKFIRI